MQHLVGRLCGFRRHPVHRGRKATSHPSYLSLQANTQLLWSSRYGQQLWPGCTTLQRLLRYTTSLASKYCVKSVGKGVYGIWETTVILQIGSTVLLVSLAELLSLKNCLFHIFVCMYHGFFTPFWKYEWHIYGLIRFSALKTWKIQIRGFFYLELSENHYNKENHYIRRIFFTLVLLKHSSLTYFSYT